MGGRGWGCVPGLTTAAAVPGRKHKEKKAQPAKQKGKATRGQNRSYKAYGGSPLSQQQGLELRAGRWGWALGQGSACHAVIVCGLR